MNSFDETNTYYVSRAALKLASISNDFGLDFKNKVILDVGSSTGGFTDFALKRGADRIIAVEAGKNQLHPSLHNDQRIELHEQTDIRDIKMLSEQVDIVLIDVSFISLKKILPHIRKLISAKTMVIAMLKPQFETASSNKNHGIIKNERIRRQIIKDFEIWLKTSFVIVSKADSKVFGAKGNKERFYVLLKH